MAARKRSAKRPSPASEPTVAAPDPASTNAFIGSAEAPTDAQLTAALGPARPLWDELHASLVRVHDVRDAQWRTYSKASGWSHRLLRGDRAILYASPCAGAFTVSVILGDAAMETARAESGSFPEAVRDAIASARRYAEGTGLRFAVRDRQDLAAVLRLAEIKLTTGGAAAKARATKRPRR